MPYTLGTHFERFIGEQVRGGRYASASEVVRDALRLLEEEQRRAAALATLGAEVARGTVGKGRAPRELLERVGLKFGAKGTTAEPGGAMTLLALPQRKAAQSLDGYVREHLQLLERELFTGVPYEAMAKAAHAAGFAKVAVRSFRTAVYRARKMRAERAGMQRVGKSQRRRSPTVKVKHPPRPKKESGPITKRSDRLRFVRRTARGQLLEARAAVKSGAARAAPKVTA